MRAEISHKVFACNRRAQLVARVLDYVLDVDVAVDFVELVSQIRRRHVGEHHKAQAGGGVEEMKLVVVRLEAVERVTTGQERTCGG